MFGIGKEERTGRYVFSVKSDSFGIENVQTGVYLDTIVALLTIDTSTHFYIYWMCPSGNMVKGHVVSGEKSAAEGDVLQGFRRDLLNARFPRRKLLVATSMDHAASLLSTQFKLTQTMVDGIIEYIKGQQQ